KVHTDKMKKQPGELNLEMERTKDILQSLGEQKKDQFLVGFAAETRDILAYGEEKLKKKNLEAIIINKVKTSEAGFEGEKKEIKKKDQFLSGYEEEKRDILEYDKKKLKQKNLDAIIINNVKTSGAGFEGDTNIATYLNPKGEKHELPLQSKDELATNILKLIVQDMKGDKQ